MTVKANIPEKIKIDNEPAKVLEIGYNWLEKEFYIKAQLLNTNKIIKLDENEIKRYTVIKNSFIKENKVTRVKYQKKLNKIFVESLKEDINARYQNPDGTFKKQRCGDGSSDEESKFCGCVNYMHNVRGLSWESARKLCAYIARHKK